MKKITQYTLSVILAAAMASTVFAGGGNRVGSGGASELLIPVGTRDLAMGGASIALTSGIDALYWNPAGVAKMTSSAGLYVSHMTYIADIGVDYAAVSANFEGFGILSLSLKSLSFGDIIETSTQNPDGTGKTFSPQYFTGGITYSRQLSEAIAVGLTANLVSERIADVSATGIAFNVGVMYQNVGSVNGLSLGVVVKNIGPQMKFDGPGLYTVADVTTQSRGPNFYKVDAAAFELPSTLELGLGYKRSFDEENAVMLSTSFQNNNFADDEYKVGAEYGYSDMLFVRGGYNFAQKESENRDYVFGATFGAGVHYPLGSLDLTFDYAFRSTKFFESNHVISLKLGF